MIRGGAVDRSTTPAAVAIAIIAIVLAGCATTRDEPAVTFPPATFGAGVSTSATDTTRRTIEGTLAGIGLTAAVAQSPFRPGESPRFTDAPRIVLDVALPGSEVVVPISIYEFTNEDAAVAAGDEQARYVASPVGRVQFAPGTQFVIRHEGRTVVFYAWLPAEDVPGTAEIATALAAIGVEIEVPG